VRGPCQWERRKPENDWHDHRHQTADHNQPVGWRRSPDVSYDGLDSHLIVSSATNQCRAGAMVFNTPRVRPAYIAHFSSYPPGRNGGKCPHARATSPMGWPTRMSAADQEIRPTQRSVGRASPPAFGLLAELFLSDGFPRLQFL
jgi:hypothetical protein